MLKKIKEEKYDEDLHCNMLKADAAHKLLSNEYGNSDEEWSSVKKECVTKKKCQVKKLLGNHNHSK